MIQGGDPRGDGSGDAGYSVPDEIAPHASFLRGALGMPKSTKDTGGCQVFVMHASAPHLDQRYTAFGEVIAGIEVVDRMRVGDRIRKATLVDGDGRRRRRGPTSGTSNGRRAHRVPPLSDVSLPAACRACDAPYTSSPRSDARLAQLVEQVTLNHRVVGSSPTAGTIRRLRRRGPSALIPRGSSRFQHSRSPRDTRVPRGTQRHRFRRLVAGQRRADRRAGRFGPAIEGRPDVGRGGPDARSRGERLLLITERDPLRDRET